MDVRRSQPDAATALIVRCIQSAVTTQTLHGARAFEISGGRRGGTLNAPLVNYYERGTFLTLNHAHTALFGAFGLLANARSTEFYSKTLLWQWLRSPGDVLFAVGALLRQTPGAEGLDPELELIKEL